MNNILEPNKRPPPLIAHRGAKKYAPENTLAAFRLAHELGATWVEFDVKLTKDNVAIVMHDDSVARTTNGKGKVADFTYAELQQLDAGTWFDEKFAGESIPTFVEVMQCLSDCHLAANVEIKPNPGKEAATAEAVVNLIQRYWPTQIPKPLVSSFQPECLIRARELDSELAIGLLMDDWHDEWVDYAKRLNPVSVHLNHQLVTKARVDAIHQAGCLVLCYTVNDAARADELFQLGVDSVFSDDIRIGLGIWD